MEQIGKVGVRGIELEGKAAINDRVNLTLAYSYWDAEIREDGTDGNIGNRPSRVPRHLASAWLDYTVPGDGKRGDLTLGGGISARPMGTRRTPYRSQPIRSSTQPSATR